jgi:hypothetical protein
VGNPEIFDHIGFFFDESPGTAGLPFSQSPDDI